jgi:heat shock protein HslJ
MELRRMHPARLPSSIPRFALLPGAILLAALTSAGCATAPRSEHVATASAVPLVNTNWRLTNLGDRVIENPVGGNPVALQLQPTNMRLTGFAGCNRMFGGYLLNADQLKFDRVGATRMACVDESRMKLEQEYFQMLSAVARWKITGSSLELIDASGSTLASFAAAAPAE